MWKPKSLFSLDMLNLVSINKFQRSRLTFDLSVRVAHIGVPSTYENIVFSEITWPIETKFHMTTPCDWLAKTYTKYYGHMTNMATTPIYDKNYLNLFLWNKKAIGFGTLYVELGMWALPGLHNNESMLTLTYFMARSNLIPNAFI